MERSGGIAAIVCDTTGNTVRQGYCYTCLAIGGGISVGSPSEHILRQGTPNESPQTCAQDFQQNSPQSCWTACMSREYSVYLSQLGHILGPHSQENA